MAKSFESYVLSGIYANNEFGIEEIKEIKEVRTMAFERDNYQKIINLIKNENVDLINGLPEYPTDTSEYLIIMKVIDQDEKEYIVTVYDSDLITQDPQVIEIVPR